MIALLDWQSGTRYEGEPDPVVPVADEMALRVWGLLSNGWGGIDWAGLPFVAAWLGISDIDGLMHRLHVIKHYKKTEGSDGNGTDDTNL